MDDNVMSGSFGYRRLLKYVFPSVLIMIVTSIYSIVDGFFISNFAGKEAFAAVNLVIPFTMMLSAFGFMIGSGGAALISFKLGAGKKKEASETFSLIMVFMLITAIVLAVISFIFMPYIVRILGATDLMLQDSIIYGRICMISIPMFVFQSSYTTLLMAAGKGKAGLVITLACGVLNMVLDYILVYQFELGIIGAGSATVTCEILGGIIPTIYLFNSKTSLFRFTRFKWEWGSIKKAATNGISEMVTNISVSVVSMVYNIQLLNIAGENGVAAYGAIMYVSFIFLSVYFGFANGINPLVGYKYGEGSNNELKRLLRESSVIMITLGIILFALSQLLAGNIAQIYVGYDDVLKEITINGFRIFTIAFIFQGFNIFSSAFFTGLGNGKVSGIISFLRTFLFQLVAVLTLPILLGINGVWSSIVVAEIISMALSVFMIAINRKKYGY